jgi:tRNA(Ile)-lysidine synthase
MAATSRYSVIRIVEKTIDDHEMLASGDSVLVGVSGGPDSASLVHILVRIAAERSLRLGVAHLHHGLRPDAADRDAEFVAAMSRRLGLPCYIERRDVYRCRQTRRLSLEEAARQVRYEFFGDLARCHGYTKIAVGHHADDSVELMLMFLLRGSGPLGFSGIPAVRDGRIVRPLIRLTRRQIREYLTAEGIEFVEDATNRDQRFLRNRIRHRLLPLLREAFNPAVSRNLRRFAEIIRAENQWLEDLIAPVYRDIVSHQAPDAVRLSLTKLRRLPTAAQRRLIRRAVGQTRGSLRRIGFNHVEAIRRLVNTGGARRSLDLPDGIRVLCGGEALVVKKVAPTRPSHRPAEGLELRPRFSYTVPRPDAEGLNVLIPEIGQGLRFSIIGSTQLPEPLASGQQVAFFDMDGLEFPLILRHTQPGDRFQPLGLHGTQKLKKFFIDHKVAPDRRAACPVLVSGGRIAWLVGHRIDHRFRVTTATRSVLRVERYLV